jgi:uncharacterized integral membrane protein (TIGR00701 family)
MRQWWRRRRLRLRLTSWYVAAMIVVLAAYVAGVFVFVSRSMSQALDSRLRADYAWAAFGASGWLHAKLLMVFVLVVYHVFCGKWLRDFQADRNQHSHVFYRWINEVPVLFLFAIVLLATLKPF